MKQTTTLVLTCTCWSG